MKSSTKASPANFMQALAEAGIASLSHLRKVEPYHIEKVSFATSTIIHRADSTKQLLNRRMPFGHEVLECLRQFPVYQLTIKATSVNSDKGRGPVEVDVDVECGLSEPLGSSIQKKTKGRHIDYTSVLTLTSDNEFVDYRRIP